MKRIALLAVLVLLCAGSMAFAADTATVALTGGVEGGAQIVLGANNTIQQYTKNEGTTGWANLSVAATLGDMAATFYLRSTDFVTWTIPNAWVTEKLFDKMLELRAGNIDNGATGTANQGFGGIGGIGIQAIVNPIAGLAVGVFIPAPLVAADLVTTLGLFKVGATYSITDIANIAMTYQGVGEFDAGVDVKAIKNLTLQLEALIPTTANPTMKFFENVGYAMDPIWFNVSALETLPSGGTMDLTVTPYVKYVTGIVTLWAQVAWTMSNNLIAPEVGCAVAWNGMGTFKLYYDGSFGATSSNTINIDFVHSF